MCGQVNVPPGPPPPPGPHLLQCPRQRHTKPVSNCSSVPRESQTPGLHVAALTVLERGPLGPRGGKKQSTALPRGQPTSHRPPPPPAAERRRPPPPAAPGPPTHPKMTAFHTMMLFSEGAPLTPAGGSSCSLWGTGRAEAPAPPPPPPGAASGRPCALRVTQAGSYTPLRK